MRWWWASSTLSSSAGNKVNNLICLLVFHDLQNNTTLFAGNSFSIQEALGLPDNNKICAYNGLVGPTSPWTIIGSSTICVRNQQRQFIYCVFQLELQKLYNIIL